MCKLFRAHSLADKNLGLPPLTVPADNPQAAEKIDAKIFPLHLTPQEKTDLLAFMQTLTASPVPLD